MFRDSQNKYIFGIGIPKFEVYFRQFGSFTDNHNVVTVDILIHDENRIETRINDIPIEP